MNVRRMALFFWAVLLAYSLAGCGSGKISTTAPSSVAITTQVLVTGLTSPLDLEHPNDGSGRLFVVEQAGTIRIIQNGALLPTPFLDITSKVMMQDEMGLLGVTFHPNFAANRKFYVNYTRDNAGQFQSVIAEYQASAGNANFSDPATERILLTADQVSNFTNHKAGQLAFGADGFLYFGLGDGGSGGDPFGHGQNTQILLGKLMRIDVNSTSAGKQYAIPPDNPFVAGGGLPEIYVYGFRNPWRFSFDGGSGRLFMADVGQDSFEEIDIVQKGGNYGWNTMEGFHCFNPPSGCNVTGLSLPIIEIAHPEAVAVIGGFVYHGTAVAGMQGMYVFGDLTGKIWNLTEGPPNTFSRTLLSTLGFNISSFGQDAAGELYIVDIQNGRVLKIVPR